MRGGDICSGRNATGKTVSRVDAKTGALLLLHAGRARTVSAVIQKRF
jgi:hypothetical protein